MKRSEFFGVFGGVVAAASGWLGLRKEMGGETVKQTGTFLTFSPVPDNPMDYFSSEETDLFYYCPRCKGLTEKTIQYRHGDHVCCRWCFYSWILPWRKGNRIIEDDGINCRGATTPAVPFLNEGDVFTIEGFTNPDGTLYKMRASRAYTTEEVVKSVVANRIKAESWLIS